MVGGRFRDWVVNAILRNTLPTDGLGGIVKTHSAFLIHARMGTMSDIGIDELRGTFRSDMRKGTN